MKENDELIKCCFNCNQFFIFSMNEPSEYGICIADEDFVPYYDDIFENSISDACQKLIDHKKFCGDNDVCDLYEPSEIIEFNDDSPLAVKMGQLIQNNELSEDNLEEILLTHCIDWKTISVDNEREQLQSDNVEIRNNAINKLAMLIINDNTNAFELLFDYFKSIPPPKSIQEVHSKIDLLHKLKYAKQSTLIIPHVIEELHTIKSNNSTRQWISNIFKFLEHAPISEIHEPLTKMMNNKKFSYRLKQKIKATLENSAINS